MSSYVLTYIGDAMTTDLLTGSGNLPTYGTWGTGSGTAAKGDTAMFTEAYSTLNNGTGNQRAAGTLTQITTSQTNDTFQNAFTLTAPTGGLTVTEAGIFDTIGTAVDLVTAPSGGNMFAHYSYTSGYAISAGQSIVFELQVQFA